MAIPGLCRVLSTQTETRKGDTKPHLKNEASQARRGLCGSFARVGKAECFERSGPVSKREVLGGRKRMKVWEREHQTQRGHRRSQQGRRRAGPDQQAPLTPSLPAAGKQGPKRTCHKWEWELPPRVSVFLGHGGTCLQRMIWVLGNQLSLIRTDSNLSSSK